MKNHWAYTKTFKYSIDEKDGLLVNDGYKWSINFRDSTIFYAKTRDHARRCCKILNGLYTTFAMKEGEE